MARFAIEISRVGPAEHRDGLSETAHLLDTFLASFDQTKDQFYIPDTVINETPPIYAASFVPFLDLPTEVQKLIFSFFSTPYVTKLYSED